VWDSKKLIGALGDRQSVAHVCDPGKHYFISRSVSRPKFADYDVISAAEAELLPGNTYDLPVANIESHISSAPNSGGFKLYPVTPGSKEWAWVSTCVNQGNHWITRRLGAADYEQKTAAEIDVILHDFVEGKMRSQVKHLSANDHRL
jgi:hypothetical protein